jgi:hypothetical protein
MSSTAVDLTGALGGVGFMTLGDSANGGSAFICSADITLQSSIVWTPNATPIQGGCSTIAATIAGPTSVAGTMNVDPLFVDEVHRDYHLGPASTAIDAVDTGPMTDVEGTARPQRARFDIGAFEAK